MLQLYCSGQSDLTMQERTFGSAVVQAVTDRIRGGCIYSDDRLFIRRLAIVQSDDGNMATTYRSGYFGGIWQVDEDKFNTTTNCAHHTIREECSIILSEFEIDWSSVQWTDLLKPLYSGLAASLYLKLRGADPAPGDLTGQASLWKSYFQPTQELTTYTTKIQQKESTADDSCDNKPIDIVFIIDESGSVGSSNFSKVLTFLTEVVDYLNIGPTAVQVGLVTFYTGATLEFPLGTYSTKTSLKSAILNTPYRGGGTNIGAGIQHADKYVFPIKYGGRKDATKIAILVTDGVSYSATFTKRAADDAKANHIRIFAVGIGNINIAELNSAASDPNCTHVFVLTNFKQIDDIIYEIKKSACRASNPVGEKAEVGGGVPTVYENNDWNNISNPCIEGGPKYHSHPTDLAKFITCGDTQKMYISQCPTGKIYSNQGCVSAHVTTFGNHSVAGGSPVDAMTRYLILCRVGGNIRECQSVDLSGDFYDKLCEGTTSSVQNPCTSCAIADGHLLHPHPLDDNKYITCDGGNSHTTTQCPPGERFSVAKQSCIPSTDNGDSIEDDNGQNDGNSNQEDDVTGSPQNDNPCTPEARAQNKSFFPYTPDRTKFIQCDGWGNKFIMSCPPTTIWSDTALTCVNHGTSSNPCTGNAGKLVAHSDPTKFIKCDGAGTAHVMSCPGGLRFYASKSSCDW
ncbi:Cartilage matrix protein [Mizuhopecten yessoensis]|uniref:Cartilage matrix protein n=1 Tax=Mizuhopecten yessoensis TaxID=6573 RepID=A0A210Q121_MIZYE|nr:Cartilage matrix protein [Mizuhopecten yessoensis]